MCCIFQYSRVTLQPRFWKKTKFERVHGAFAPHQESITFLSRNVVVEIVPFVRLFIWIQPYTPLSIQFQVWKFVNLVHI